LKNQPETTHRRFSRRRNARTAGGRRANGPPGDGPAQSALTTLPIRPESLIWIKADVGRACASFAMPPTPPTDPAREAADLMNLAAWYRDWAAVASTEHEKAQRIDFAIGLEKRARAMLKPD
jgi:hypothetical protein